MARKKEEAKTGPEVQLVVFRLRDEEFGVGIQWVREIIRVSHITRIPEAPSFIEGVINLRGEVIAVADLAKLFGLPEKQGYDPSTRIIVVEVRDKKFGILVDEAPEVLRLSEDQIEETPPLIVGKMEGHYLTGVGKLEGRLLILLDLEKVMAVDQFQALENTQENLEVKQSA